MPLLHPPEAFRSETILARAAKYGFANPLAVELFLWDLEVAAQLQSSSRDLILKGGAAAQVFVPPEKQRGSRDIDIVTSLDEDVVEGIMRSTLAPLEGVSFKPHTPKKPKKGLPLRTYFVSTRSAVQTKPLEVKADFLLEDIPLSAVETRGVETFAVTTATLRCFRPETLVGDKILTLANGSIGLENMADCPKHIYDICALLESPRFHEFEHTIAAIETLTPVEGRIRGIDVAPDRALSDVVRFAETKLGPIDTSMADEDLTSRFEAFEQFFAPRGQKATLQEWSARALKVRFVASLARATLADQMSPAEAMKSIGLALEHETKLRLVAGDEAAEIRKLLLRHQKAKVPYFKELRGKPVHRVFWQVVTPANLDELVSKA